MKTRVVLDTNVLISAFLWQGKTTKILELVRKGLITICVSREILDELQRVLSYPKFYSRLSAIDKAPKEIVDEFLEISEYYSGEKFPVSVIKEDPSDDKILACALAAQASFIVSGDKHLLKLKKFRGITILSPKAFLKRVK